MDLKMFMFLLLLAATAVMLFISWLSFRRSRMDIAKYCALVMLSASIYSFGYAFEIISDSLEQVKFWLRVQYIGAPFIATFWLILVMAFTGHQAWLNRRVMALLFVIPVTTMILHFTNDAHHLFYQNVWYDPDGFDLTSTGLTRGPWYVVHMSYLYVQAAIGIGLFLRMYSKAVPIVRKQVVMLIAGTVAPWLTNIVYLATSDRLNIDLTPFGFTLSGAVYLWGIFRFHLLRLVPIAYQTMFDTIQDGVMILDFENMVNHANQAAKNMLEPLKGFQDNHMSASELFAPYPELVAMIAGKHSGEARIAIQRAEDKRYYQVKQSVIYDKSRYELGKIIFFNDVTQVTVYQERLLANANQLEELHAFKDDLFAIVTHDIRDPMALLINLTEIIEEDYIEEGSEKAQIFKEISSRVGHTFQLVENMLDWLRSQSGSIKLKPIEWALKPIVQRCIHTMKQRVDLKRIRMVVDIDESMVVYADKDMLELIVRNLLFNAVKYTETEGRILIRASRQDNRVTVSVRDTGAGVDPRVAKTLFREVQHSSAPGTDGMRGSGLGLYLCGRFVRLNGGDIWFESVSGEGSTFFFTIPSRPAAVPPLPWKEVERI